MVVTLLCNMFCVIVTSGFQGDLLPAVIQLWIQSGPSSSAMPALDWIGLPITKKSLLEMEWFSLIH